MDTPRSTRKRTSLSLFAGLLLLSLMLSGCGNHSEATLPENPDPLPTEGPQPLGGPPPVTQPQK